MTKIKTMDKIEVYKLWIDDAFMITVHKDNVAEEIKNQMESMDIKDFNEIEIGITKEEMTQEEYDNLPEFEGF